MAMAMGSSPLFLIHHHHHHHHPPYTIKKTSTRISMLATQNTSSSLIPSINIQKVFEDKSRGIVCYLDDKGEMTCEGYDEGPRLALHHHTFSPRGQQQHILHLLNRSLLQVIDAASASGAANPN